MLAAYPVAVKKHLADLIEGGFLLNLSLTWPTPLPRDLETPCTLKEFVVYFVIQFWFSQKAHYFW